MKAKLLSEFFQFTVNDQSCLLSLIRTSQIEHFSSELHFSLLEEIEFINIVKFQ